MRKALCILLICALLIPAAACAPDTSALTLEVSSCAPQAAGGNAGSIFLTEAGDVYTYGAYSGSYAIRILGVDGVERLDQPTKILSDVVKISENYAMPFALKSNGDLYVWGKNGSSMTAGFPAQEETVVTPRLLLSDVADAGYGYAVKTNGELWVWGYSWDTRDAATGDWVCTLPHKVMDNVRKAGNCGAAFFALTADARLFAWGNNEYGEIGNGESGDQSYATQDRIVDKPVEIMTDVRDFSVAYALLVIQNDGSLWAWGDNEYGAVGNGESGDGDTKTYDCLVTRPCRILENAVRVFSEYRQSFAITENGDLYGWGRNSGKILAGEQPENAVIPLPEKLMEDAADLGLYRNSISVLTRGGAVYSWGNYGWGTLGSGLSYTFEELYLSQMAALSGSTWEPQYCLQPTPVLEGVEKLMVCYGVNYAKMTDGSYCMWGMDTFRRAQTYGQANYVKFAGGQAWYGSGAGSQDHTLAYFGRSAQEPVAADDDAFVLTVLSEPTVCTFPPYQNGGQ